MNLSNPERVAKLAVSLLRHPSHIPRYLRYGAFAGPGPLKRALPWWSFEAIDAVAAFCTSQKRVFEYGTGGSTVFLASRCSHVTCVEDDPTWLDQVVTELRLRGLNNFRIELSRFDFRTPVGFESSAYLRALSGSEYDIVVVDGQDMTFKERLVCFRHAEALIRPGGLIVVDDSWRYPELREANKARRVVVCESTGPCRVGVTSTDLFYY